MGDVGKTALAVTTGGLSYVADEAFFAPARRAQRLQKDQARMARESRKVDVAMKERERQLAIRQQQRQERIRRAQVISAAEAAGVSGASVEASTLGSGQTLAASGQAFATGASMANRQVSSLAQCMADIGTQISGVQARGQMFQSAFNLGLQAFTLGKAGAGGGTTTTTTNYAAPSNMSSVNPKIAQMPLSM